MRSHFQFLLCVAGLCAVAQAQSTTPTISGLNPTSLALSTAANGFTLMVLGTNFQNGCYVTWSDSAHPSSILATGFSATTLTATVPAGFITVAEQATISVGCPGPVQSNQVSFTVTGSQSGGGLTISTTSPLPSATTGASYSVNLTASGGTTPYTWSLASGSVLPNGLTLGLGGALTGTPTTAGQYTFTIQVKDSTSPTALTAQQGFSLTVGSPGSGGGLTITTSATLPQGTVGANYSQTLAASGGTPPYLWSALTALPPGLNLNPDPVTGVNDILSGTPTAASGYAFTIQVSDSSSPALTKTQTFTLTISPPGGTLTISTGSLPAASAGQAYTTTITAYGGNPPYTFAVASSTPTWLSIDPNAGTLSGTPPATGTYSVTVQVSDSTTPTANTASKTLSLSVTASSSSLSITTPTTLPAGVVGVAYSQVFAASGGMGPYTFVVFSGSTDGLAFGTDNVTFSGTPQAAGTFNFTVEAADSTGLQAMANFTLTVTVPATPLTITTSSLPGAVAGQTYTATLAASGGTAPYKWSAATGTPSWLMLSPSTGALSGTPPATGTFTITVQVTDSTTPTAKTASRSFTLVVTALSITTASPLPAGTAGTAYTSTTLAATGGTPPYTWVILSGNTDGLSLASTGVISGTPQTAGTFTLTVQVTDNSSTALQTSKTFSLTVSAPSLTITSVGSSSGTVGVAFSQSYTVVGGTAPYTWKITSGTVPGLTLNASASPVTLSGTPTQQGSFTITLQATDANGAAGTKTFTVTIAAGPLKIMSANQLPAAVLGSAYSFTMAAVGGTPPYTWSATGLPSGISINSVGLISGTISAAGTVTFVVKVTDSATPPATAQNNFSIGVTPPALPAVTVSGLPATANPLGQYTVTVALASAYPVNITGTAILSSAPTDNGPSDGSIQFSGGGKSASFTINAGQTSTTLAIQTGSVAGTITLTLSQLSAGGSDITPTPAPSAKVQMAAAAPVITAATVSRSGTTLTIQIIGYATSRDMQQAVFTFTAASGQTLQTGASSLTVQLSSLFSGYFPQNASTGSQFVYSQPFTIQGDINSVIPQNVTLTNRIGSSTPSAVQ